MAEAPPLTPLEAAHVIATAQVDADAAKRRAAGYTDMLWGLLLPALLVSMASFGNSDSDDWGTPSHQAAVMLSSLTTYGLAIGGLVLSFLVTRNQAISLAPPVRSIWFWVGLAVVPFLLFLVGVLAFLSIMTGRDSLSDFRFLALWSKWWMLGLAATYVLGRGLYLRKQSWYGSNLAASLGLGLLTMTTAVVVLDGMSGLLGMVQSNVALHVTAVLLGITWFTHGVLLYNRS